jgi:hypothetical protein
MSHTPGPWEWDQEDGTINDDSGYGIAIMHYHGNMQTIAKHGEQYSHANARLIAAAPTLLAACQRADIERGPVDFFWEGTTHYLCQDCRRKGDSASHIDHARDCLWMQVKQAIDAATKEQP